MNHRLRNLRARKARRSFIIEQLESRELMAADALSAAAALAAPLAATASDNTTALTSTASTTNDAQRVTRPAPTPAPSTAVRSFEGTGNNLIHTEWGSTNEQLLRAAAADYADDIDDPAGEDRLSPREISNALIAHGEEDTPSERQLSAFIYIWGQFLDHDIDLTEPPTSSTEAMYINVPMGDDYFDPNYTGTSTMAFNRSRYDATTGTSASNPRQQINQITAWIDGSMIYGSSKATSDSLRTFVGGKLRTSAGALPPTDATGSFVAGDVRANENIELSSMHALFLREHNQVAARIAAANPRLSDEQVFQQARAIVIGELQAITYNEFLPALLGQGAIDRYRGYNASVDPSIANEFSTAAFRLHTLINDDVEFFGNDGRPVRDEVELRDAFFNPALLKETGIDNILKYAASTNSEELDTQIVDGLRNFLFGAPGQGGLDLASLNIQRGRDHGLADYNSVREAYGLARVTSFADITSDVDVQQTLASVYGSVDNIDLWVGAVAENHVPGASVGETIRAIVSDQFERLRDGDRFWYQRQFAGTTTLAQIERTTLADVIKRNTSISNLQGNVFFMQATVSGQVYLDSDGNGQLGRREVALPGITVKLLNDEGVVVATTTTGRDGRYRFTQFRETGDYQVVLVVPARMAATTAVTRDILISRGGLTVTGANFGLRLSSIRSALASALGDTAVDTDSTDIAFADLPQRLSGVRGLRR